jgi:hypothetical protein
MKQINLVELLLIYYLINLNCESSLLSKKMKLFIEDNRIAKHFISIITIFVLISIFHENMDLFKIMSYSLLIYLFYILSTKANIQFNIIIFVSLFLCYLWENKISNTIKHLSDDKTYVNKNLIDKYKIQYSYIYSYLGLLLTLGVLLYSNKKEVQYGGSYSIYNFLLN